MITAVFPSNLHTHTLFCDGRNTVEEYVLAAIEKQFVSIGFSGHSYLAFGADWCLRDTEAYMEEVKRIKKQYAEKIAVYLGIETDYYSAIDRRKATEMGLDFTIGSVHYVADAARTHFYCVDNTAADFELGIKEIGRGSVQVFVEAYYQVVMDMLDEQTPDIIGHLDLVKKLNHNNRYFDEASTWYTDCLKRVCQHISKSNAIVEINTGGIARGYTKFPYPSRFILEQLLEQNVGLTINSDAHQVDKLDFNFTETVDFLKQMGCPDVLLLKGGKFEKFRLN